ncbi:MAG: adenosylhomocysteinase [Clostridia bacterium]|nr:adenosylhomocysteinase [Clostridia bacterium]
MKESMIKDIKLASQGVKKLHWVKKHMPILNQLENEFRAKQYFKGHRVVICLHLEAKTGYLAQVIKAGGAEVAVAASNPLSTQDDVVAALVQDGIKAYAWHGATNQEYFMHLNAALDFRPDLIIDDGGDLVALLHKERPEQVKEIIGGCEETTTGILRLKIMSRDHQLKFPMMAVNDAYCKYLFDNRYGTGQSVWDGINRTTNLVVAGKNVVVAGYGWCGKGVAMRAKGLGAKVIITEVDPIKAIEAHMDGFRVMPMQEAVSIGDFFITVTGNCNVIRKEHFLEMNDGAILANAGHFDIEISKEDLLEVSFEKRDVRPNIEQYILNNGKSVYLLAEGRLVNLAAGDGHPAEIMDLTFALQTLCLQYVMCKKDELESGVYPVPEDIDKRVANLGLSTLGINIDSLTNEQIRYLESWHA